MVDGIINLNYYSSEPKKGKKFSTNERPLEKKLNVCIIIFFGRILFFYFSGSKHDTS
jgi:hypothetical protein